MSFFFFGFWQFDKAEDPVRRDFWRVRVKLRLMEAKKKRKKEKMPLQSDMYFAFAQREKKNTSEPCSYCSQACKSTCLSIWRYPYNLQTYFALLQVPSAPPTYTGRQLWWGEKTGKKMRGRKWREEEDGEVEGGGVWDGGTDWMDWTYNMDANRALPLRVQTITLTACQLTITVWCMSVCETESKQDMEDRAKVWVCTHTNLCRRGSKTQSVASK